MDNDIRTLRNMRFTLGVYTVMSWGWGFFIMEVIEGVPQALAVLLPLVLALPLLFLTLQFSTYLRGLAGPRLFASSRVVWLYITGNAVTLVGFVLANVIARVIHHPEYAVPGALLALGLHFLFIALAFQETRAYLTLAVFCLTALLVPLTVPLTGTIGPLTLIPDAGGWTVAISLVSLVWFWLVTAYILVRGGRISREIQATGSKLTETAQA
ncbi:MAG TPA: hypothetical protein VKR06_07245 [Ktedonosporobacter sp.]|nr:hypothetical protein [Ktedonosporobacter sp.]